MADVNQEILLKLKAIDELTPVMLQALNAMQANSARMAEALDKVSKSTEQTEQNTRGLHGGVVTLHAAWELLKDAGEIVAAVMGKVADQVKKGIHEAIEGEKATNRLTGAMVQAGIYTKELSEALQGDGGYIEGLEKSVGANGEVVKSMIATGLQFGLTIDKAKELEQAARQLAAANGIEVQEAFSALKASLAGNSRALGQMIPQVKDLGSAQLKAGAAIDLVNKSTKVQYEIFQQSLPAAFQKGQVAIDNLYKALGQAFTENAAVRAGVDVIVKGLQDVAHWAEQNKDILKAWVTQGILLVIDSLGFLNSFLDITYRTGVVAFEGVKGALASLALGIRTLIDGPIVLFYKALSYLPGEKGKAFEEAANNIISSMGETAATVNQSAANIENALNNQTSAAKAFEDGLLKVRDAVVMADAAEKQHISTKEKHLEATSQQIGANMRLHESYAGFDIGTRKQREALNAQVQDRDNEFKKFEEYYNAKLRLAVEKEDEQATKIAQFRAKQLTHGGAEAKMAGADAEVNEELDKQDKLSAAKKAGLINRKQFEEEMRLSQQAIRQQELIEATAHTQALAEALGEGPASLSARKAVKEAEFQTDLQRRRENAAAEGATAQQIQQMEFQAKQQHLVAMREMEAQAKQQEIDLMFQMQQQKADLLGESEAGYQMKQQIAEQRHQFELQEQLRRAQEMELTPAEQQSLREQSDLEHKARMKENEISHWEQQAQIHEKAGNDWDAFLARMQASQAKHGAIIGALKATENSQYYKGTMDMLSNVSALRNSHSKTAFEVGKKAAIAEATVKTFMAATSAYAAMAAIPIVGPALGAIAAAAAIAAGFVNIQKINAQKFEGGQADEGMDSVPQSLAGKSFILAQGERVVQPSANKDLTAFLQGQNPNNPSGGRNGSGVYNITLNYQGNGSQEDAKRMAEMVMKEIRAASERGTQVLSAKGVY